jgi:hypothetical protein
MAISGAPCNIFKNQIRLQTNYLQFNLAPLSEAIRGSRIRNLRPE